MEASEETLERLRVENLAVTLVVAALLGRLRVLGLLTVVDRDMLVELAGFAASRVPAPDGTSALSAARLRTEVERIVSIVRWTDDSDRPAAR